MALWTMSRPMWNQHNYHITNVNDDWSVPANEPNSWEVHNTYRTQTPERSPAPSYLISLTYTAGISGVMVLTNTASMSLTATPPVYAWSYRQEWYEPVVTTTFDSRLTDVRPGEARLVAEGTLVAYRLPSGLNYLTLPPLYASAPHIVAVEPTSQTAPLGGAVVYTITLSNPAAASDVYTLALAGLPAGWAAYPPTVTLPAGAEVTVPLTVSLPVEADPAPLTFSVIARNSAGGTDQAAASLDAFDALDLALTPASVATTGLSGVFTLTLTNLDDAPQTVHLAATGLADVSLPASVVVPGDTTASLPITATAYGQRAASLHRHRNRQRNRGQRPGRRRARDPGPPWCGPGPVASGRRRRTGHAGRLYPVRDQHWHRWPIPTTWPSACRPAGPTAWRPTGPRWTASACRPTSLTQPTCCSSSRPPTARYRASTT